MPVKIYYNDQIFRLAKLPATLEDLKKTISELYSGSLPSSWLLQYVDSDGDKVVLSHSDEYSELQDVESQGKAANVVTKLYITAINNNKLLEVEKPSYQAPEEVSKAPRRDSFEIVQTESVTDKKINYPVLPEVNEIEANKTSSEASSQLNSSQYQVEQMATAKESTFAQEATGHTNPSAPRVEKVKKDKAALKESKKKVSEAIELIKQLEKGKLTSEEATKASERLNELELTLDAKDKKILEDKKQKHIFKMENKEAKREAKKEIKLAKENTIEGLKRLEDKKQKQKLRMEERQAKREAKQDEELNKEEVLNKEEEPKVSQETKRGKKSSTFRVYKTLQKIRYLFAKGKIEKIEKSIGKLVKMIPESSAEQFNTNINNVLAVAKGQNTSSDMLENELKKTEQVFIELSGPAEEKQKRADEWIEAEKVYNEKLAKNNQRKEERLAKKAERVANKPNKEEKIKNKEEKAKTKEEKARIKEEKTKSKEDKIKNKEEKIGKKEKKEKTQRAQMLNN